LALMTPVGSAGFDARELEYELPAERIAQAPLAEREGARLLCMQRDGAELRHRAVRELPELLSPSLIVLNDTRVLPARLVGHKPSGGKVELLLCERLSEPGATERWLALAKGVRQGHRLALGGGELLAVIGARVEAGFEVELRAEPSVSEALVRAGQIPLPPYIKRAPDARDAERYQTVFAAHEGAVAAPTAGLHLGEGLLQRLRERGHELAFVTLHVGPGTFAPLRSSELAAHRMHPERYHVPEATVAAVARAREQGRSVLAVGTTVVRTLESASDETGALRAGPGATSLFIYPPYRFRVVDALMTNFHLPCSTLLALVMAFGGVLPVRRAYQAAVANDYRFYSYGDAMLIGGAA
jgi:S-adenosylmethionine:tRNA ribosyltransferase-isomerase